MANPRSLGGAAAQSAEQIFVWQVAAQIVGALMLPLVQELQRGVNSISQTTPLSPPDLADMSNRAIVSLEDATAYAKQSGVSPQDFLRLVQQAGNAISPQEAVLALRRGIIERDGRGPDQVTFEQAVAESRIKDKWTAVVEALGAIPLPVADAVDAVVESQIDRAEGEGWARKNGIDPDVFEILVNTRGNPPSPTELNTLHKRGLIPLEGTGPDATSVQQGIFEGATKNKWWRLLAALSDYLPPPRTVTALIREGSLDDQQGLALLQSAGLTQDLAQAYIDSAHHQKLAGTKDLAKGIVDQLYHDQIVTAAEATSMYEVLGYTAAEIPFLIAVQDMRRAVTAQDQAISRIHAQYVNHRIDRTTAVNALNAERVPDAQVQQLLGNWDVEVAVNVKVLTPAEIASAFADNIIDQDGALAELQRFGYSEVDAWILLSVRMHHRLPNPPAGAPPGPSA